MSLLSCAEQCIMAAGNGYTKTTLCQSFTYNLEMKNCRLYDHNGLKVPAIMHPVIGTDLYQRTSEEGICRGPMSTHAGSNPNFVRLGHPLIEVDSNVKKLKSPRLSEMMNQSNDITTFRTHDTTNESRILVNADVIVPKKKLQVNMTTAKKVKTDEKCDTTTGYYIVIGNEIVMPISGEGYVKIYNDIEQGDCAKYCSSNAVSCDPNGESLLCNSLNYFPRIRKCELYSIQAEPHGTGNLVENENVIYAEKFCLPESRQTCQNDEIFILHVQKSLSELVLRETNADSIKKCLQSCLNTSNCKTSVFNSNEQKCLHYSTGVDSSPESVVDTHPGVVMIENGCSQSEPKRMDASKTIRIESKPNEHVNPLGESWSEWSECKFRVNGQKVKVRTNDEDGGLETAKC
uniref:PAN domain protein n=1 Tax=Heterorhabditis bacteriophora TaxID=37862 RepID=A0A1I7W716_HETBA